jgi:hypothetical protein
MQHKTPLSLIVGDTFKAVNVSLISGSQLFVAPDVVCRACVDNAEGPEFKWFGRIPRHFIAVWVLGWGNL